MSVSKYLQNRLRHSRERASQGFEVIQFIFAIPSLGVALLPELLTRPRTRPIAGTAGSLESPFSDVAPSFFPGT